MEIRILIGGSGRWQTADPKVPEVGGRLRDSRNPGRQAIFGRFSLEDIAVAVRNALSDPVGNPPPGIRGGAIVEVEI